MVVQSFGDMAVGGQVDDALQEVDVAIIGAGVSGLYCARRLLDDDPSLRVTIVERLNRTGGRLDSDLIHIGDSVVREEEGGMRFNYDMTELMNLIKALELCDQIVPFPMSSAEDTNRFHLRGHSFTAAEAAQSGNMIWSQLYDLKPEEQGLSPTDLVTNAYRNVLYANDAEYAGSQPPSFWSRFRNVFTWRGVLLSDWLLWGLLRDMGYSEECVEMLSDSIGFAGPFKGLANAGDAFQILADFPKDPTYFTFRDGFSTLPNALVADLEERHADRMRILLSANVDAIDVADDGESFSLSVTRAPEWVSARPSIPGGTPSTLRAKRLFVAVATKGAEDLIVRSPAFTKDHETFTGLWDAVHASVGMRLMKINLYFNRPWWENGQTNRPPVQFGPNFTDLPVNAVYPFYAEPVRASLAEGGTASAATEQHGATSDGNTAQPVEIPDAPAALTIYCDFSNTNFWQGLQGVGPKFSSPLQDVESGRMPQVLFPASQAVVAEARKQLQALFDVNWVPEPVMTSYRLWNGEDDFEFAYHQWRQGVDDRSVRDHLSQPLDRVHFCNESFSDMQGWVNGSLRSCDAALSHAGIDPMPDDPCPDQGNKPVAASVAESRTVRGPWGG